MSMFGLKRYAIIVAGGSGTRMGGDVPKQFLELGGKPVLFHSIEKFHEFDSEMTIIVVLPKDKIEYWQKIIEERNFSIKHEVVAGGDSRFMSVKNGLALVDEDGIVAVHDGVRPLVSVELIKKTIEMAEKLGNAVPITYPVDSVRMITEKGIVPVDRRDIMMIQTPQVFKASYLKEAYDQLYHPMFTDDATVMNSKGHKIFFLDGERQNIKLTTQEDMLVAEVFMK